MKTVRVLACVTMVAALALGTAMGDVKLPAVIGSNMVLQQGMPAPIWGWAEPGEEVSVSFDGQTKTAKADADGQWMVRLDAMKAQGDQRPRKMTVAGKNTLTLENVLVGEVWVCSGQSNMEMGIGVTQGGAEAIAAADYPNLRLFAVPKKTSGLPLDDVSAAWTPCSPASLKQGGWGGFSAAGYYFGREIHKALNVPVAIIGTYWGGTRIEPWTPPEGFAMVGALRPLANSVQQVNAEYFKAFDRVLEAARKARAQGKALPPFPELRHPFNQEQQPTALYNAMVHPLIPFAIRGALWYQGESNMGEGMLYCEKMKALIGGWRKVWAEGDFPFYFVQLAPFRYNGGDKLPRLWEAQTASLAIPNTGMAVITDLVANVGDIHPVNKLDVGKRLALWALAKDYGREGVVYSGPLYKSMKVEGSKIRIRFDSVGGGLVSRDGKDLAAFEIAGADKKFVPAKAVIDGETVVVSGDGVAEPAAVRFGWNELAQPNLANKESLPASPFRTDNWN